MKYHLAKKKNKTIQISSDSSCDIQIIPNQDQFIQISLQSYSYESEKIEEIVKAKKTRVRKQKPQKIEISKTRIPAKTFNQESRIIRSKKQKIYLIGVTRTVSKLWTFTILGTKGIPYHVNISKMMTCTCFDFQRNWKPCKHIYFIITQIAKDDSILRYLSDDVQITHEAFDILDDLLLCRLGNRVQDNVQISPQKIDLKDDPECSICFLEMLKQKQKLQICTNCKKYFHKQCLNTWKKHKNNCPLCRGLLDTKIIRQKGALQKLNYVNLQNEEWSNMQSNQI